MPLITIITATYNAARHLPALIESIREQTYVNIEWIVVDGASTDGTQDFLIKSQDVVSYWSSEPDQGIYDAWNKGLAQARGEWVVFLGADDFLWSPEVFSSLAAVLSAIPDDCVAVYGELGVVGANGELLYALGEPWPSARNAFRCVMNLPHPGLMHRRSATMACGGFDPSYRIAGDYALLRRMLRSGSAYHVSGLMVAGMRVGGVSTRPGSSRILLREMRRAAHEDGARWPGLPWLLAWARYAVRATLWQVFGERAARRLLDLGRRACGKPPHWTRT
jgi:glycosyltransferase involved in cell wall biosynthesis